MSRGAAPVPESVWRGLALTPSLAVFMLLSLLPVVNLVAMSMHEIRWAGGRSTSCADARTRRRA